MLDNQQIQNNWPTIKSHILSHWKQLSESDVENTHGDANSLGKLIEKNYGDKEDFDTEYERLVTSLVKTTPSSYTSTDPKKQSSKTTMNSKPSLDTVVSEGAMDKDRDDMYLSGPNGVTRRADTQVMRDLTKNTVDDAGFNEEGADGFHNLDRSSKRAFGGDPGHRLEEEILKPDLKGMEVTDALNTPMRKLDSSMDQKNKKTKHKHNKQTSDDFKTNQDPRRKGEDITLGRSNSSANTTSKSALTSSEAMSKDTKKL